VTLVKGGAGTGKTALAVARVAHLSQTPEMGYGPVLYLCFNRTLAATVAQILDGQFGGRYPRDRIEVSRVLQWSQHYLSTRRLLPPVKNDGEWLRNRVGLLLVRHPELKQQLDGSVRGIVDEIRYILRPNGFASVDEYLGLERRGMRTSLKQAQRSAIWLLYSLLPEVCGDWVELEDLPQLALTALASDPTFVPYRAVVVDEAQDLTPVMIRLTRAMVGGDDRRLFVLADVAQSIYPSGFYWAQRELRARGGQVNYLRTSYRTTREVHALAQSLYDGVPDAELQQDLGATYPPARSGPLPELAVHESVEEEASWLAAAIRRDLEGDAEHGGWRPEQIAVLAQTRAALARIATALSAAGLPIPAREREGYRLDLSAATIKLATIHSAKGLDFPVVYLAGLTKSDLFESDTGPGLRPLLYVGMTRSGFRLVLSTIEGVVHPLIEALPPDRYQTTGGAGERFALRRLSAAL
jgi:superfamily I DNA/RNA helicase